MSDMTAVFFSHLIVGLSYLCYPLIGWLAEVRFTRHKLVFSSLVVTAISVGILTALSVAMFSYIVVDVSTSDPEYFVISYVILLVSIPSVIGLSMFEANAIQFGMDQLLEASSQQLSSFIHWYYWFGELSHFVCSQILIGSFWIILTNSKSLHPDEFNTLITYVIAVFGMV